MEKKNMIFLSVIAVATLLTAVVGATFAYFSAQAGSGSQTVSGAAAQLAGLNTTVTGTIDFTDALPGWAGAGAISVETPTGDSDAAGSYRVVLDKNGLNAAFSDWITYSIYKTTAASHTGITIGACTNENVTNGDTVESTMSCPINLGSFATLGAENELLETGSLNDLTAETVIETVNYTVGTFEEATYYVVYEFEKPAGIDQNAVQGMSINPIFTVEAVTN